MTGASGYVARTLVPTLLDHGYEVLGVDRRPSRFNEVEAYDHLQCDLASDDLSPLVAACRRSDVAFHLAALPSVRLCGDDVGARRHRDNVVATKRFAASAGSLPLLHFSSSSVYGGTQCGIASRESDDLKPNGGYACSKAAAEKFLVDRGLTSKNVLIVRPFTMLGRFQRPDMAITLWRDELLANRTVTIFGGLERSRDFLDVRNACKATLDLAQNFKPGVVNLCRGRATTLRALSEALVDEMRMDGGWAWRVVEAGRSEPEHTLGSCKELETRIGALEYAALRQTVADALAYPERGGV